MSGYLSTLVAYSFKSMTHAKVINHDQWPTVIGVYSLARKILSIAVIR